MCHCMLLFVTRCSFYFNLHLILHVTAALVHIGSDMCYRRIFGCRFSTALPTSAAQTCRVSHPDYGLMVVKTCPSSVSENDGGGERSLTMAKSKHALGSCVFCLCPAYVLTLKSNPCWCEVPLRNLVEHVKPWKKIAVVCCFEEPFIMSQVYPQNT